MNTQHNVPTSRRINSLSTLVLAGFLLAGLPLLWTIWSSIQSVGELAGLSQKAVVRSSQATQHSRVLTETLTAMERSLRQYFVLNDIELFAAYQKDRQLFVSTVDQLHGLKLEGELKVALDSLVAREKTLFESIGQKKLNKTEELNLVKGFSELNESTQALWKLSAEWVDEQSAELKEAATDVQKDILKKASFLLPAFIILVILFTYLIARPIRQLERSIGNMSGGDLNKPIIIEGPADIRSLGERLNFLRQKLKKLEEDQQKFLQQVSHELKTPLASINEGAGLLSDEVVGKLNGEQTDIVHIMKASSLELQEQINTLLEFNRLNAQKNSLNIGRHGVLPLVNQAVTRQRILLKSKNIDIKLDLPKTHINVDKQKIDMVLDNLLSNAIKYSPQGGEVVLSASILDNKIVMLISDQGYGLDISEEFKIFDLFYQGHAAKQYNIQGNGLGLAIAKDLVEAHGGSITADINYKGGAKFVVTLPMELS